MTDLLLVEGGLPRHLIENLRIIQDSGRALLAIVNNILDISKLNAHKTSADTSVRVRSIDRSVETRPGRPT